MQDSQAMPSPLSPNERSTALAGLPLWTYDPDRRAINRRITATDFVTAIGIMMSTALVAERANHHPEWSNVYNRLDIWLTTHDAGDVTARDIELAHAIDQIAPVGS